MSFDKTKGECFCERCGHYWKPKPFGAKDDYYIEPKSCAKCKSKVWNQPRVYAGKYISGTLARRFKPTGRAAAQLKKPTERIPPEFNMGICVKCGHPRDFDNFCCKQTKELSASTTRESKANRVYLLTDKNAVVYAIETYGLDGKKIADLSGDYSISLWEQVLKNVQTYTEIFNKYDDGTKKKQTLSKAICGYFAEQNYQ